MTQRPRGHPTLAEPDELDRLVEVEARLEKGLADARTEARRRIAAAEAAARAAAEALDCELAPEIDACRERVAHRLAEEHAALRRSANESAAALDALDGARFEALVGRVLSRLGSPGT